MQRRRPTASWQWSLAPKPSGGVAGSEAAASCPSPAAQPTAHARAGLRRKATLVKSGSSVLMLMLGQRVLNGICTL